MLENRKIIISRLRLYLLMKESFLKGKNDYPELQFRRETKKRIMELKPNE